MPDIATQACVFSLHKTLDLPLYGLVDCDQLRLLVYGMWDGTPSCLSLGYTIR
jgi:hypothetical protein